MKLLLIVITLSVLIPIAIAEENIIYDDGTGAKISYQLPVFEKNAKKIIEFTTYRISVAKDGKFLLFLDLPGKKGKDGKTFSGTIIIPSNFINSAKIIMLGSVKNSSMGIIKKIKVSSFQKINRDKSWEKEKE